MKKTEKTEKTPFTFSYSLLKVELVHFNIEDSGVIYQDKDSITDLRPNISAGVLKNEYIIDYAINCKAFQNNEICSITTSSQFKTQTNLDILDNLNNKDVVDFIARLGFIANSQLMGMFRVKSDGTSYSRFCIPIRDMQELSTVLYSEYNRR
jgi:hypothetical protein